MGVLFVNNVTPYCMNFWSPNNPSISVNPRTATTVRVKRSVQYQWEVRQWCGGPVLKRGGPIDGGANMWWVYEASWMPR